MALGNPFKARLASFSAQPRSTMKAPPECEIDFAEPILEKPLLRGLTFHLLALSICCGLVCMANVLSLWLILQHAVRHLRPREQRHIIRILALVPIYTFTTFLSLVFYKNAVHADIIRALYESFAVASLFKLLCNYIAPDLHKKETIHNMPLKNWTMPLSWMQKLTGGESEGLLRIPKGGWTWFNIIYFGVYQSCILRPILTTIAIITHVQKKYCQSTKSPFFAYIWISILDGISVSVAFYCLMQFHIQMRKVLARHRPFLKFVTLKVVVVLGFGQNALIALLTNKSGPVKPSNIIAGPDLRVGIPCLLICIEMVIFAFICLWTFPWQEYDLRSRSLPLEQQYICGPLRAILEAIYPGEYFRSAVRGCRWVLRDARHRNTERSPRTNRLSRTRDAITKALKKNEDPSRKRREDSRSYPTVDSGGSARARRKADVGKSA